jgi:hypothetical protein
MLPWACTLPASKLWLRLHAPMALQRGLPVFRNKSRDTIMCSQVAQGGFRTEVMQTGKVWTVLYVHGCLVAKQLSHTLLQGTTRRDLRFLQRRLGNYSRRTGYLRQVFN